LWAVMAGVKHLTDLIQKLWLGSASTTSHQTLVIRRPIKRDA
jgi:hypothetical protein